MKVAHLEAQSVDYTMIFVSSVLLDVVIFGYLRYEQITWTWAFPVY